MSLSSFLKLQTNLVGRPAPLLDCPLLYYYHFCDFFVVYAIVDLTVVAAVVAMTVVPDYHIAVAFPSHLDSSVVAVIITN